MSKFEYLQKLKTLYIKNLKLGYSKFDAYRKAEADMRLPSLMKALSF